MSWLTVFPKKQFNARSKREQGMSLVEVMITMGVASGLVLAVMEAVTMVTKQTKSVQTSSDWTALIGNINRVFSDSNQCTCFMKAKAPTISAGLPLGGPTRLAVLTSIDVYGPSGTGGGCTPLNVLTTLLSSTPGASSIVAAPSGINLYASAGNNSLWVTTAAGPSFWQDKLELDIRARKVMGGAAGTSAMPGGAADLYSTNLLTNRTQNGIAFSIIRNSATGVVQQCYGLQDQAQAACMNMGGLYDSTMIPSCQLERLRLGRDSDIGPPTVGVNNVEKGQKLALWRKNGSWGVVDAGDFGIGIENFTMWFNASGVNDGFKWYHNNGTNLMASLYSASGLIVNSAAATLAFSTPSGMLSIGGESRLAENANTNTRIGIGGGGWLWVYATSMNLANEYHRGSLQYWGTSDQFMTWVSGTDNWTFASATVGLGSFLIAKATGAMTFQYAETHNGGEIHNGVETHTGVERHSGVESHTGVETHMGQVIISGATAEILNLSGATNTWNFVAKSGPASNWSVTNTVWFDGPTIIGNGWPNGSLTIASGAGGNVPHACTHSSYVLAVTAGNPSTAWCTGTKKVISGGCRCSGGAEPIISCIPWVVTGVNLALTNRWDVICTNNGGADVTIVCCEI